jgi:hypothetical protein
MWLVDNNIPIAHFVQPAFRAMIECANPEAEKALWLSHTSVNSFVIRLYDHLKPQVIVQLSKAMSVIHICFDGWSGVDN